MFDDTDLDILEEVRKMEPYDDYAFVDFYTNGSLIKLELWVVDFDVARF